MTLIEIDDTEWEDTFHPINNPLDSNASCGGQMFETYGEELDYVLEVANSEPRRVWTYVDGDKEPIIISGYHVVNRIGYFITEVAWDEGTDYNVLLG